MGYEIKWGGCERVWVSRCTVRVTVTVTRNLYLNDDLEAESPCQPAGQPGKPLVWHKSLTQCDWQSGTVTGHRGRPARGPAGLRGGPLAAPAGIRVIESESKSNSESVRVTVTARPAGPARDARPRAGLGHCDHDRPGGRGRAAVRRSP